MGPKKLSPGRARALKVELGPSPGPSTKIQPEPWRASNFYTINKEGGTSFFQVKLKKFPLLQTKIIKISLL